MTDRTVTYRLSAQITQFKAQMAQASASVKKFASDATSSTKDAQKFRTGLESAGGAAGRLAIASAAALGGTVAVAANFEQSMSKVKAATGESAQALEQLRDAAIKAGAETAFSATEAAAGIENLAKAGVSTTDILDGGLTGALDLAAAGSIEVGEAAEIAAKAMTQFGLEGDQVPHVADLLAAAAGKASGEVSDFGMALSQSGLVANQVGLSIEETTGALASFAYAGLLGSDAGTSFKTMLGALTPNSAKAEKAMSELGISAFDAQGSFIGLAEFAGQLRGALKNMSAEQRQATLETIFGSDAVRAASVLYEQGERGIDKWTTAVDDQGFAAETAATKLDNLKGDVEAFTGALETALIGAGDGKQNLFRGIVQGATDAVNAFAGLPPSAQDATTSLLGITAVTAGGAWFGSRVIRSVADTREALDNLGLSADRTKGKVGAIGKGFNALAGIEGLKILDDQLADLFNLRLEDSNLGRSIEALSQGRVESNLAETFGGDLEGFAKALENVRSDTLKTIDIFESPLPGKTAFDEAKDNIAKVDEQLAALVDSGSAEQAQAAFDELAKAAVAQGLSVDDVRESLSEYSIALRNAGLIKDPFTEATSLDPFRDSLQAAINTIERDRAAKERNTTATRENAQAIRDSIQAQSDARAERLRSISAEINFQASIDDARQSLKENGKTLDITTEKGRSNRLVLLDVASAWNDLGERARKSKDKQRQGIDAVADAAVRFGMTREAAIRYAKSLLDIPAKVVTKPELDDDRARAQVASYSRMLDNAFRDRTTKLGVQVGGGTLLRAQGGPVYGAGTKTSDSIPARLSQGEWVIKAAAVDHYGHDFMSAINTMRFASGGPVSAVAPSAGPSTMRLSQGDLRSLATQLATVRPMYGDAHFYGDSAYQQAESRHRRGSALGGRR